MSDPAINAKHLPALGFLAEIPEEHRTFLACFGKYLRPRQGDTLITEGEAQESLYVILEGQLHIVSGTADGHPMLLASLEPGDSMGEINLFDPGTASASAVARSSSLVWLLSRSELDAFLEADPVIGVTVLRALLAQLARRIRSMNEKLATANSKSTLHDFWNC